MGGKMETTLILSNIMDTIKYFIVTNLRQTEGGWETRLPADQPGGFNSRRLQSSFVRSDERRLPRRSPPPADAGGRAHGTRSNYDSASQSPAHEFLLRLHSAKSGRRSALLCRSDRQPQRPPAPPLCCANSASPPVKKKSPGNPTPPATARKTGISPAPCAGMAHRCNSSCKPMPVSPGPARPLRASAWARADISSRS